MNIILCCIDYITFDIPIPEWICQVWKNEFEYLNDIETRLSTPKTRKRIRNEEYQNALYKFDDIKQLYYTLLLFPSHLRPYCMNNLYQCVFFNHCIFEESDSN